MSSWLASKRISSIEAEWCPHQRRQKRKQQGGHVAFHARTDCLPARIEPGWQPIINCPSRKGGSNLNRAYHRTNTTQYRPLGRPKRPHLQPLEHGLFYFIRYLIPSIAARLSCIRSRMFQVVNDAIAYLCACIYFCLVVAYCRGLLSWPDFPYLERHEWMSECLPALCDNQDWR